MPHHAINFQIPNEYGSYLVDILEPIPFGEYKWIIDTAEIHLLDNDDEFTNEFLFKEDQRELQGEKLYNIAKSNTYYMVFATLRAYHNDRKTAPVRTYQEFLKSDCLIGISVSDCSYVMIWCKNSELIKKIYDYAIAKGYENIEYISEEDLNKKNCCLN